MNIFIRNLLFFAFISLTACACKQKAPALKDLTKLCVNINRTQMLYAVDAPQQVLKTLNMGDTVFYCNKMTTYTSKRLVLGVTIYEPWLQVQTADRTIGWVYAGALQFDALSNSQLAGLVLRPRFEHFFGKRLAERVATYNRRYDNATTQENFAAVFREGKGLRDSLQGVLTRRIAVDTALIDMFWLRGMVRGMAPMLSDDRMRYVMAYDFEAWYRRAFGTRGEADEQFISVLMLVNNDGVERRIHTWQQCDRQNCSQPLSRLGSGEHLKILLACDATLAKSKCFESELLETKTTLINDITEGEHFAQTPAAREAEIMDILATPMLNLLQEADRNALDTHLKTLRQAKYKKVA
jgi:hypothetical protein